MSNPSKSMQSVLLERAALMRHSPTSTEALLWSELRGGRLGVPFRRQVVIGRRIADFCAPSIKLVVEVDGGYHAGQAPRDARRERELAALGYRVVRVDASLVSHDLPAAVALVRAALVASAP